MPIAAAAITGGVDLVKGFLGSNAANKAGNYVNDVARSAGAGLESLSQAQYEEQQKNLSPYLNAGQQGANSLAAGFAPGGDLAKQFSFDPSQIANNPNYQFVLAQGNKAVQQSAAAQGGLFSGGTLKALDQYSQGLATQTVNDAYAQSLNTFQTNHNNLFQGYSTLANIGENASGQLQNAQALRLQGNIAGSNDYITGAEGKAAGTLGAANQWNQALNGIAGAATTYLGTRTPSAIGNGGDPIPSGTSADGSPVYIPANYPMPSSYPSAPVMGGGNG